jgi:hypothetical protein
VGDDPCICGAYHRYEADVCFLSLSLVKAESVLLVLIHIVTTWSTLSLVIVMELTRQVAYLHNVLICRIGFAREPYLGEEKSPLAHLRSR